MMKQKSPDSLRGSAVGEFSCDDADQVLLAPLLACFIGGWRTLHHDGYRVGPNITENCFLSPLSFPQQGFLYSRRGHISWASRGGGISMVVLQNSAWNCRIATGVERKKTGCCLVTHAMALRFK